MGDDSTSWWSKQMLQEFNKKAQCYIDQYNNYTIPELIPILGKDKAHVSIITFFKYQLIDGRLKVVSFAGFSNTSVLPVS